MLENIEEFIKNSIAESNAVAELKESLSYCMLDGGKRIRPGIFAALVSDFATSHQDDTAALYRVATALEMLHCSSLIHDDLPALDNDTERRGKASCHVKFGESTAILTGDYLISFSSYLIADSDLPAHIKVSLLSLFNSAFMEVCSGQVLDLKGVFAGQSEGGKHEIDQLKTASLFRASVLAAYYFCDLSSSYAANTFEDLGTGIGLYFQLANDYHDYFALEKTGRSKSSDTSDNNSNTFFGLDEKSAHEKLLNEKAQLEKIVEEFCLATEQDNTNLCNIINKL